MSRRKPKRSPRRTQPSANTRSILMIGGIAAVAIVGVLAALILVTGSSSTGATGFTAVPNGYPYPVQAIERINDRSHFPLGQTYNGYNSNPPTSGPHAAQPANWGVHDEPVAKEQAVHNMEHGGSVVWYNCNAAPALSSDDCTQLRNDLSSIVLPLAAAGKHILMTPYDGMDSRIALTSWGFLDKFDQFDATRVSKFIDTFTCNFDPEHFCG